MARPLTPLAITLSLLGLVCQAHATPNQNAKVLLHVVPRTTVQSCTGPQAHPACSSVVTSAGLYPALYYAYTLIADGDAAAGIEGTKFGIQYDSGVEDGVGLDIFEYRVCASIGVSIPHDPPWPASGTSFCIFWDLDTHCQRNEPGGPGTGVVATMGYFYCTAYSPATLRIIPIHDPGNSDDNKIQIYDCSGSGFNVATIYDGANPPNPSTLGFARFSQSGTESGYNPCQQTIPVKTTTWSRIKNSF